MDYLNAGIDIFNEIKNYISNSLENVKTVAGNILDKLSVQKVNFTLSVLTSEVQKQLKRPEVAKAAVCDLNKLSQLNSNVPEWANLYANGVTHMIVLVGHDEKINEAYFYHDLSNGGNKQVDELINRTGEGMVVINA